MASKLNPYISFPDGKAREALEFYQSVLGGELTVATFGESGMEGAPPDQVMHGQLETESGFTLMGADAPAEMMQVTFGDNVAVSISGDRGEAEDMRRWFEGLAQGGQVTQPLAVAPWGDEFGMFQDRFGIQWLVNIAGGS